MAISSISTLYLAGAPSLIAPPQLLRAHHPSSLQLRRRSLAIAASAAEDSPKSPPPRSRSGRISPPEGAKTTDVYSIWTAFKQKAAAETVDGRPRQEALKVKANALSPPALTRFLGELLLKSSGESDCNSIS